MSVEHNKTLARRFWEEVVGQGNLTVLDEIMAAEYIQHQDDVPPGRAGLIQFLTIQFGAFPDRQCIIEDIIGGGDRVVTRTVIRATHTGSLGNIPATGKQVSIAVYDIWRVGNGKLAEHWGLVDNLGMMRQLGMVGQS
jgi:predicted ester cyclase